MIPDVNVVVASARDDHPHHALATQWWSAAIQEATSIVLLPDVVAGCLRILTHPKVFESPNNIDEATAHVDALLALPNTSIAEREAKWETFKKLCVDKSLRGNAIPDAWIAASVLELDEHLVTLDKDFRKLLPRSRLTLLNS